MWPYRFVSREVFETRKEYVSSIMIRLGAYPLDLPVAYPNMTTTICSNYCAVSRSQRTIYQYGSRYYRIDEVLFPQKPFIVLEAAQTLEDVQKNCMEDLDPFPYDLSDDEIEEELRQTLFTP